MKRISPFIVAVAALSAAAAGARGGSDPTRLDDFAVPQAGEGLAIEQLPTSGPALSAEAQVVVRELAVSDPALTNQAEVQAIGQLSQGGSAESSAQLSGRQDSRELALAGVSSRQDSRPDAVARLQGEDRCDPQTGREQPDSCDRILERRAEEFAATEAPTLSAEQALLAARGESAENLAPVSSSLRLRLAGGTDPDARIRQNQELAAIYLERPPTVAPPDLSDTGPSTAIPEQLSQIIEALQQGSAGIQP